MTVRLSDRDWLLTLLGDGRWHSLAEIIRRSEAERGHGLTVHSRASDLRKAGHTVEQTDWRDGNGRRHSSYRLVSRVEPQSLPSPDGASAACGSTGQTPSTQPTTKGDPVHPVAPRPLSGAGVGYVDGDGQLALIAPDNGAYRRAA